MKNNVVIGLSIFWIVVIALVIVGVAQSWKRDAAVKAEQEAAARAEQERIAAEKIAWEQSPEGKKAKAAQEKREQEAANKARLDREIEKARERDAAARAAWERDAPARAEREQREREAEERAEQERKTQIARERNAIVAQAKGVMRQAETIITQAIASREQKIRKMAAGVFTFPHVPVEQLAQEIKQRERLLEKMKLAMKKLEQASEGSELNAALIEIQRVFQDVEAFQVREREAEVKAAQALRAEASRIRIGRDSEADVIIRLGSPSQKNPSGIITWHIWRAGDATVSVSFYNGRVEKVDIK